MKKLILLLPVLLLFAACLDDEQREAPSNTYMADKPVEIDYDGDIIYLYPRNLGNGTVKWSVSFYSENAGATSLSDGRQNTDSIVNEYGEGSYAAYMCDTMTAYGYDDWYLPSKDELNAIYQQKDTLGSFSEDFYWSSTEYDEENVWVQDFTDGTQTENSKSTYNYFRCVRRD
ncbi:MAG: DUF1566 domain-containing protein [Bacteroidales bacterium]